MDLLNLGRQIVLRQAQGIMPLPGLPIHGKGCLGPLGLEVQGLGNLTQPEGGRAWGRWVGAEQVSGWKVGGTGGGGT